MTDARVEVVHEAEGGRARAPASPASGRRRLLRHYLPLATASAAMVALSMNASFFDANRYPPPADIFTEGASGALPDGDYPPRGDGGRSQHEDDAAEDQQHGGSPTTPEQTGPPSGAHTGPPAGGHEPTPSDGSTTDAAGVDGEEERHAGDQDSVLRMRRYSTATGYVATAFLALTLLVGPANLLLRRRNPLSGYLRRDVGIWTAIVSVIHVVFGFLVKHGDGQLLGYFFQPGDRTRPLTNSFGLANWTGLGGVLIVGVLAAISSDVALRKLKARKWKRIQRLNYALFVLVVVHAVFYGALWRTTSPYTVLLGLTVATVAVGQAAGVRVWRRRHTGAIA